MADGKAADPADWVLDLIRDYQDKLTCGLFEAIYRLDRAAVEPLMQAQAKTCVSAFLDLGTLRIPMELGEFLQAVRTAGPSQIEINTDGDVIHWTELHRGQCVCPFVRRGVVRLDAKLCVCGAYWIKHLFESITEVPVEVETIETVATGAENCRFRITLTPDASA